MRPSHAANWRPLWNVVASPTLATTASAVSRPTPGSSRAAGGRVVGLLSGNLLVELGDAGIERVELVAHVLNLVADRCRLRGVESVLSELAPQPRGTGLDHHAEFGEQTPDAVKERRALLDPALPQACATRVDVAGPRS